MSVFRTIAAGNDQIIYATQSSLFVDLRHFDQICLIRREHIGDKYESKPTQLPVESLIEDLKARHNVEATEASIKERYAHVFNPMINEGFFGDKVIIVEGPSEQYSLPIYADALGYNFDTNNISVVHCDGKGQMDRMLRVFSGFGIPSYIWFDADKDDKDQADSTIGLLELVGNSVDGIQSVRTTVSDRYTVLEYDLETTLHDEISDYDELIKQASKELGRTGKPLKHRYIASQLKQRVDQGESAEAILPKTIREIVSKIRQLSYTGSILKKLPSGSP